MTVRQKAILENIVFFFVPFIVLLAGGIFASRAITDRILQSQTLQESDQILPSDEDTIDSSEPHAH